MKTIYANNTTSNLKTQIYSSVELKGKGIKNFGGDYILQVKGELIKGLTNYWVSQSALNNLKNNFNVVFTSF